MPILIVALIALTVFGAIGILLLAAVILEGRMKQARQQSEAKHHFRAEAQQRCISSEKKVW